MSRKSSNKAKAEKPIDDKRASFFSPEVNAAIIGALALILGYLLINFGVADNLLRNFRTHKIEMSAQPLDTGSAYSIDGEFHPFRDSNFLMAVGEVSIASEGKTQEVESRFLIAFFIGDIPKDAEIENVQLEIPCKLQGDVSSFSGLRLKALDTAQYDPRYFDAYTADIWSKLYFSVGWRPGQELQNMLSVSCKQTKPIIIISRNDLISAVSNSLPTSFLQFILWFDQKPSLPNGQTDAIVITGLPRLLITYVSK